MIDIKRPLSSNADTILKMRIVCMIIGSLGILLEYYCRYSSPQKTKMANYL